jgi:hypothetical protein
MIRLAWRQFRTQALVAIGGITVWQRDAGWR